MSRTVIGQPGHSILQDSMLDDEEQDFNKEKVLRDWTSFHCQQLGMPIPQLGAFQHHECTCKRFAIDVFGDHLHSCTQHAGATMGAHEHILTVVQTIFIQAGYRECVLFIGTRSSNL
jgi:hypothetical protein